MGRRFSALRVSTLVENDWTTAVMHDSKSHSPYNNFTTAFLSTTFEVRSLQLQAYIFFSALKHELDEVLAFSYSFRGDAIATASI